MVILMYFSNISDTELTQYHKTVNNNFQMTLTNVLTSSLFKIETIIADTIYKIYPLFYCKEITSNNEDDRIMENKCVICTKQLDTILSFKTENEKEITGEFELGYSVNHNYYGICVYCFNQVDSLPLENVLIDGKTQNGEEFTGKTNKEGFCYMVNFNKEVDYFKKFDLIYNGETINIKK